jgi:hypothetical protein
MATNTPHAPFFEPFFAGMARLGVEEEARLHENLIKFLESQAVNARTDDDKTLALAIWMS